MTPFRIAGFSGLVPRLAKPNGFSGSDSENFAARTSHWALDVSNVENATVGTTYISQVPEPDSFAMLLAGLGLLGFMAKRKKVDRKRSKSL
jgi:hypothetical protein